MPFYDGRILGDPIVSRRLVNTQFGPVEIQDVTIEVENVDEILVGDPRGVAFTLDLYETVSATAVVQGTFIVSKFSRSRGRATIMGTNLDLSVLEGLVPVGVVDPVTFPLAPTESQGKCPPWIFGNVTNLPLLCVRDGVADSTFDYLLGRGTCAGLRGLRRLSLDPAITDSFTVSFEELEPSPGMDGTVVNGSLDDWDDGAAAAPTGWTAAGSLTSITKTTVAADVSEGTAAAVLVASAGGGRIQQNLVPNAPTFPLARWQGREVAITARCKTTIAGCFIRLNDGVAFYDSIGHTGSGLYETLVVGTVAIPVVTNAAATGFNVQLRAGGAGTVIFDDVRVYYRARSWEEVLRTDLYDTYTAVRFYLRQSDSAGALYPIVADVNGLQAERNPVRAIRTLLTDATHGLGKTVDATSFDAAEIAMTFRDQDTALLDAPELALEFYDTFPNVYQGIQTIHDGSGHERHGVYDVGLGSAPNFISGGPAGGTADSVFDGAFIENDWITVPDSPAFSGQTICLEHWFRLGPNIPDVNPYPIIEKTIGSVGFSQYTLWRQNNFLIFGVKCVDTVLYSVQTALVDVVDEGRYIHIVCIATGGVLQMWRDGVLAATGSYAAGGALMTGSGEFLVGKFGTPNGAVSCVDLFSKIRLYTHALSAARIAAHYLSGSTLNAANPVAFYDMDADNLTGLTHAWRCDDSLSLVLIVDRSPSAPVNGTWTGTPGQLVAGPLSENRGRINGGRGAAFVNDVANYGTVAGMTLAMATGTVLMWYNPAAMNNAGILEKTIAGVRDTQWGFRQRAASVRFTLVTSTGTFTADAPLAAADIGRYGFYAATWTGGTLTLYRNAEIVTTTAYTGTPASGVGNFYIGIQGTNGAGLTRPGLGSVSRIHTLTVALTIDVIARLWLESRWYNGGLSVDFAMPEARQAQAWIRPVALLRGLRLGVTTTGTWTCTVDTYAAATVALRDGPGDGTAPNLLDLHDRTRPGLKDAIRDYVLKFRKDYVTNTFLCEQRYVVSTQVDAHGDRIGQDWTEESEVLRVEPAADRAIQYLGAYAVADETVIALVEPLDAEALFEGMRVLVTDTAMGYSEDTLLIRDVRKGLKGSEMTLAEDPGAAAFTYTPTTAFPISPGPEV